MLIILQILHLDSYKYDWREMSCPLEERECFFHVKEVQKKSRVWKQYEQKLFKSLCLYKKRVAGYMEVCFSIPEIKNRIKSC